MKIIVAGSRSCTDIPFIYTTLSSIVQHSDIVLQGGARGVDTIAKAWCKKHGVACQEFPADWNHFGKSAGLRRNQAMARAGEVLIAIWGGVSRGTAHMVQCMEGLHKEVIIIACKV